MTAGLSVILPAFDEGTALVANVERLLEVLRASARPFEVLLVNDGSADDTGAVVDALQEGHATVRALHHERNRGKGRALQTGALAATMPVLVLLDADMQIPPTDVVPLVERMEAAGADLAVGSKYLPGASRQWPWPRRVLSRLYQLATALLFRLPLRDTQTGLKVVRREVARALMPRLRAQRFAWDLEFVLLAVRAGRHVVAGPVTVHPASRASHLRWRGALQAGIDTLRIFWRDRILASYAVRTPRSRPAGFIVSGDDLGMSPNVTAGLVEGLASGGLTSVSALTTVPDHADALDVVARRAPHADVGLHLDLLQGRSLVRFLWRDLTGRVPRAHVEACVRTQVAALRACGVTPTHLDAHRHAYLLPWTRRRVLRVAHGLGLSACRALRPMDVGTPANLVERCKRLVMVAASTLSAGHGRARGMFEPAGFVDAETATGWVQAGRLPAWTRGRVIEVVSHPVAGVDDAPRGEQGTLDRRADFERVCRPPLATALSEVGAKIGTFASWAP